MLIWCDSFSKSRRLILSSVFLPFTDTVGYLENFSVGCQKISSVLLEFRGLTAPIYCNRFLMFPITAASALSFSHHFCILSPLTPSWRLKNAYIISRNPHVFGYPGTDQRCHASFFLSCLSYWNDMVATNHKDFHSLEERRKCVARLHTAPALALCFQMKSGGFKRRESTVDLLRIRLEHKQIKS